MELIELRNQFVAEELVKYGSFKLKSGQMSDIYFNLREMVKKPELLDKTATLIARQLGVLDPKEFCVVGVPMGAIALATVVAQKMQLPQALVREEVKDHGTGGQIHGSDNRKIILIEDVVTTGGSVEKFAKILQAAGREVVAISVVLDRGGVKDLRKKGFTVHSLMHMDDFIRQHIVKELIHISNTKRSNLIVALDDPSPEANLKVMQETKDFVCGFKLHMDIYKFRGDLHRGQFINTLIETRHNSRVIIIEDRKFADIADVSIKQLGDIPRFADMVTVHSICGPDTIREIAARVGVLVIHQLSSRGNLITPEYSRNTILAIQGIPGVVGFISQEVVGVVPYITMSPGVNLTQTADARGQQYSSEKKTHFVIVGRGITQDPNPRQAAIKYCETFYKQMAKL